MTDIKKLDTLTSVPLHPRDSHSNCHVFYGCVPNPPTLKDLAWIWQAYYQPQPCLLPLWRKPTYCTRHIWTALLNVIYASVRKHTHWPASCVNHVCTPWLLVNWIFHCVANIRDSLWLMQWLKCGLPSAFWFFCFLFPIFLHTCADMAVFLYNVCRSIGAPKVRLESRTRKFNAMIQQWVTWWCNSEHSHIREWRFWVQL